MSIISNIIELEKDISPPIDDSKINKILNNYWFSWFCDRKQIVPRTEIMLRLLKEIKDSELLKNNRYHFEISNNIPLYGKPYDDVKIVEEDKTIYLIIPRNNMDLKSGSSEVWGINNDFNSPLYSGNLEGLISFFKK